MTSPEEPTTGHAERALFARLIDDAAVFPPARAPLDEALHGYLERRAGGYADLFGPLLLPVSAAHGLVELLAQLPAKDSAAPPVPVGLISRPGTPVAAAEAALGALRAAPMARVVGVELTLQPGWAAALQWDVPLSVELPREPTAQRAGLAALAAADAEAVSLRAKLRTQSTAAEPVPTAEELGAFLLGCHRLGLPAKLTGGLHRAVAHTARDERGRPEDRHGVLNVLLAAHHAVVGADLPDVVEVLLARDGEALAGALAVLASGEVDGVRALVTAYGCCGVLDPVADLLALGLIAAPADIAVPTTTTPEESRG